MSDTPLTDEEPCIKGSNIKWYELHPLTTSPHKEVKDWMKKATAAISFLEQQLKEANDTIRRTCNLGVSGVVLLEKQLAERDALLEECEGFISTQAEMIDNTGISDSVGYAPYQERLHKLLTKIKDRNKP